MPLSDGGLALDPNALLEVDSPLKDEKVRCPTRVLHIGKYYPPHVGGIETHLHYLVSHQSQLLPVEVVVANEAAVTRTEVIDGAKITRVAAFGSWASQPICPTLPLALSGHSGSLVHLHLPNPWAAKAYLMSGHKGKLIITHHADTLGRVHLRRFTDPFVRQVMKRASAIIITSKRYLESSDELIGFHDKCRVVPLGIDVDEFNVDAQPEVQEIRTKYGPRLIVAVGRLVPYKGFDVLLYAMKKIDASLLLIGSGPLQRELESTIELLGIGHKVHLLGYVKDTAPYYKAAQILVLSSVSRAESFGLVQLEAMAAGIPVVNTEIDSGVPEVSPNGVTGLTVPPKDPDALAHAVKVLLDDDETRAKYGQAACIRARREYTAQRMSESTMKVYESVL